MRLMLEDKHRLTWPSALKKGQTSLGLIRVFPARQQVKCLKDLEL